MAGVLWEGGYLKGDKTPMKTRVLEHWCFSGYALRDAVVRTFNVWEEGYVALLWLDFPPDGCMPIQVLIL